MAAERIIKILSNILCIDPEEIDSRTNINMEYDLTEDDYALIIASIEDEFNISLDQRRFLQKETAKDMAEYVKTLL